MANKRLFGSGAASAVAKTDTVNLAGGKAYAFSDKHALAQMAVTGTFNGTFYASAGAQLDKMKQLLEGADPLFVARLAVYARQKGLMKDTPAFLLAWLHKNSGPTLFEWAFRRVIDNGKMLRNFVQIVRAGTFGRKSLGSTAKRCVQNWLRAQEPRFLLNASVGNDPSLKDVIKLAHPKPVSEEQDALFSYLIDKDLDKAWAAILPDVVREYEAWKKGTGSGEIPKLDFRLLDGLPLTAEHWTGIATTGSWLQTLMNLNTFKRHGVFENHEAVNTVAQRLANEKAVLNSGVFPYKILNAYQATKGQVPEKITKALHKAMEASTQNVPSLGNISIVVGVDVSGSMKSPVTGTRGSATSSFRCVDLAALIASVVARKHDDVVVMPVDTSIHRHSLDFSDSILGNAAKLAKYGGGGTQLGLVTEECLKRKFYPDLIIMVSDNESWINGRTTGYYRGSGTELAEGFQRIKNMNRKAKMVCIDITPNATTQAQESDSILNIGGFSDNVWTVIEGFVKGDKSTFLKEIENFS